MSELLENLNTEEFSGPDTHNNSGESETTERYLTFLSDGLSIGVSTRYVTEIITNYSLTTLPLVPHYIKGIMNLRGQIVPVMDIRLRMGKTAAEPSNTICIIVLNIDSVSIGILVENVQQVLDIDTSSISRIPTGQQQILISGMQSQKDGSVLLFLDCAELVHSY